MKLLKTLTLLALLIPAWLFAERPNVVLIISDDHAWTDYTFLGNEKIQSPHIDKLAAEGLTFTRGYVTTALCSPSLATMLTGLHTHEHGITGNDPVRGQNRDLWLDRFFENPMLPKLLADEGYNTLHTGKYWMRQPSAAGFLMTMAKQVDMAVNPLESAETRWTRYTTSWMSPRKRRNRSLSGMLLSFHILLIILPSGLLKNTRTYNLPVKQNTMPWWSGWMKLAVT